MRYFGSKGSVADEILKLVGPQFHGATVCDPFGGIGTMGASFKRSGFSVCTGDHLLFAHLFQIARIELNRKPAFRRLRERLHCSSTDDSVWRILNTAPPRRGWITRTYAEQRGFFTRRNAMKIDAIWEMILDWRSDGLLSRGEHALLMASLIDSADRIANTAGTYYAYLNAWYRKAVKEFEFLWIPRTSGVRGCHSHFGEATDVVSAHPVDILYLDPPYNTRQYCDYYHFPESLALGYHGPVTGNAGIPSRTRTTSDFANRAKAPNALADLLGRAEWELLVMHYADSGLIERRQLRGLLRSFGQVKEREIKAKAYSTSGQAFVFHRVYVVERC